jgi:hypothetical protein
MKTLSEYKTLLHEYLQHQAVNYGVIRMGIFESVARGERHEGSDVDVYVEGTLHGFFRSLYHQTRIRKLVRA